MKKRRFFSLKLLILLYFLYAFVTAVLIFAFNNNSDNRYVNNLNGYLNDTLSVDRVALIEKRDFSAMSKLYLIDKAEKSLDVSYYKIQNDEAGYVFLSKIVDAANRGVKVRVLLDGKINKIAKDFNGINYALVNNENIEIKYYEPFSLLKPWTWNNLLHDKYIIVDKKFAILGGRNIGNQYFDLNNDSLLLTKDREVLVINTDEQKYNNSVISEIKTYFDEVWESPYSKYPKLNLSKRNIEKAIKKTNELKSCAKYIEDKYPHYFNLDIDFFKISFPTNKISLIHNPIERFKKYPKCWIEISNLIKSARSSVFIQSPYIIFNKEMRKYLSLNDLSKVNTKILTNSEQSTPNLFAFSGYLKYRKELLDSKIDIFEYHGNGSIHAKSYIIDDRLSLVGSFNMDPRSAFLSSETMLVIDSKEFTKELNNQINIHEKNSELISTEKNSGRETSPTRIKYVLLRIVKVLTYLFDFLL